MAVEPLAMCYPGLSGGTLRAARAANAAIVEVDRDTGVVSIEKCSWSSTDCGRLINPLLADAQIAGGVMQGLGGALCEEMVHDPDGQVLGGSFMDYAMPRADQAPPLVPDHIENPSTRNPLGVIVHRALCHLHACAG